MTETQADEEIQELEEENELAGDSMTTDEAFASAMAPNVLEGVKLFPFSLQRKTLWGELIGKGGSLIHWSIVIAWVCSRTRDELYAAMTDRPKAIEDAYLWAESIGITYEDPSPAIDLFKKIDAELFASTQVTQKDEGAETKNSGGQPAT
jgi:hypothetical protein